MNKIGIFFGPEGGSTHRVANVVAETIGREQCEMVPVKGATAADIEKYENLVFGISTIGKETWDARPVATDWSVFLPEFEKADFMGKKVALFGLGDHIQYPDHFVDAMGTLARILKEKGVDTLGKVDSGLYDFNESEALENEHFVGLPIDEDFQEELTGERVRMWVDMILPAMK